MTHDKSADLVRRLRDQQTKFMTPILGQAADTITALIAENERLRDTITYCLQDDQLNRLTPRVVDIAYSAFMLGARGKNKDDGGKCDWFTDTKPMVMAKIEQIARAALRKEGEA